MRRATRNDIDYHNLPVTVVSVASIAYGNLGYSHHAIQDYGLIRMMPNFKTAFLVTLTS